MVVEFFQHRINASSRYAPWAAPGVAPNATFEGRRQTMKRRSFAIVALIALALCVLPSCANKAESGGPAASTASGSGASASAVSSTEASGQAGATEGDRFTYGHGTFELVNGWHKYDPQSTDAKPFFVSPDYDGVGVPDNISVEYGTNHYSKDDPIAFGRAITAQLTQQAQGFATGEITASGTTSDKGEPILVFDIPTEKSQITQYYICGDNEYILVYETNFDGSPECDEVAKAIVNTFEWNR